MRVTAQPIGDAKTKINIAQLKRDLTNALDSAARVHVPDYAAFVSTWSSPPTPVIERPNDHERLIGVDEDRFNFVNNGTRPHTITPRSPRGKLRFRENYRAKTGRGRIRSQQGGASGNVVYSRGVRHPGTQAREIDRTITDKNQNVLSTYVDAVLAKV